MILARWQSQEWQQGAMLEPIRFSVAPNQL
jgi:hypothetical protein